MLPAAGQGALGIEVRAARADLIDALAALSHQPTLLAVTAERTVSRAMGGSCSMPLAAFTAGPQAEGAVMQLRAAWGDPATADGSPAVAPAPLVKAEASRAVRTCDEAEALGEAVATRLRAGGAVWVAPSPAV